jgi:superfamily II DNA or RNA helicase
LAELALRQVDGTNDRIDLCNDVINTLMERVPGFNCVGPLVHAEKSMLVEIPHPSFAGKRFTRPETPLYRSSLFTGAPGNPQLVHELAAEMASADSVDVLVSFIKWTGLRLLGPAFKELEGRGVPVRVITTSYMGASDATAVEWLARLPNVRVRVSYDTERTRLHAKAYHFLRKSGYSTAYVGSANMSGAAMTEGLEWNLKVTAEDMPHILDKFTAEFDTYWNSREFQPYDPADPMPLRNAIARAGKKGEGAAAFTFFDLVPHPFQERILDALESERTAHNRWRNLVVAATGTGKTVVAGFDFRRFNDGFRRENGRPARLLFVAHRQEILEQARFTFRNILRDPNHGELLVGGQSPDRLDHLYCSVPMVTNRRLWEQVGSGFYDYIVVDEVHHGPARSYRPLFEQFFPKVLLGLTATPERMDGESVAADFGHRFAAEIRLPEALDEKLLCPFHYFGVSDPVPLDADRFWRNGKYVESELENVYTGAHALAGQRLRAIVDSLYRYEPDLSRVRGIGFCAGVRHAAFMAESFRQTGIPSALLTGTTGDEERRRLQESLRNGELRFLFTVDVLSEGVDMPEVNTVLFLRPTESLTVFLQQLGRGLRHAPEKECLTVIDLVGQTHRKYRIDRKLKALLPRHRYGIEREVEQDFPHLPSGCAIRLERVAREHVIANIRENLRNLSEQVTERIQSFVAETDGQALTFGNFLQYHDYEPEQLLVAESWSGWKGRAGIIPPPADPDPGDMKKAMVRAASIKGPAEIDRLRSLVSDLRQGRLDCAEALSEPNALTASYRVWGRSVARKFESANDSLARFAENPSALADLEEILDWAAGDTRIAGTRPELPFPCELELHGTYSSLDINAALGLASFRTTGPTGQGVIPVHALRAYVLLVTFQKTEHDFSPTTMYADYPISRELLHWESQSNATQEGRQGQDLIHFDSRGYSVLLFARDVKERNKVTVPYTYLGPAVELVRHEGEKPIRMVWRLRHPMPAEMFEENRRGG